MVEKLTSQKSPVPELRFPAFCAVWKTVALATILREHKHKNIDGDPVFSVSGGKGLVDQILHLGRSFSAADTTSYNKVHPFDIVYTKSPLRDFPYGIVKQSKASHDVAVSPLYGVFRPESRHMGALVEAYFDSPYRSKLLLGPLSQKGAKNTINITNATFLSGKLAIPASEAEQKSIADCLDSQNRLAAVLDAKLQALRTYKRGLLQRLFPVEDALSPKTRFSGVETSSEWQEYTFGSLVERSFYGTSKSTSSEGAYPVLRMGNMEDGRLRFTNLAYIDIGDAEFRKFALRHGDILMNRTNSAARVGKISIFEGNDDFLTASYIVSFRLKTRAVIPEFCNYLLNTPSMQRRIRKLATPSISQCNINPSAFKEEVKVRIPPRPEQARIVECLARLDEAICAQAEHVRAVRNYRRGLTQRLLVAVVPRGS